MTTDQSDDSLLRRAGDGDKDAMVALLARYGPRLRHQLQGSIGRTYRGALDEDDVLQVTYIEAFLQIRRFEARGSDSFFAWLRLIAERNLQDAIKSLDRKKRPPRKNQIVAPTNSDSYVSLMAMMGATTHTPSQHAARHEAKDLIDRALCHLPPDYHQVLLLYHFENLPAAEVAQRMKRSEGAVFMLRSRALEHLRRCLPGESHFFTMGP